MRSGCACGARRQCRTARHGAGRPSCRRRNGALTRTLRMPRPPSQPERDVLLGKLRCAPFLAGTACMLRLQGCYNTRAPFRACRAVTAAAGPVPGAQGAAATGRLRRSADVNQMEVVDKAVSMVNSVVKRALSGRGERFGRLDRNAMAEMEALLRSSPSAAAEGAAPARSMGMVRLNVKASVHTEVDEDEKRSLRQYLALPVSDYNVRHDALLAACLPLLRSARAPPLS
jgi:hypothetical protein